MRKKFVAVVDYGLGNLFSIKHACAKAGITAKITSIKEDLLGADAVILPGVGAFGDAMRALQKLDLISPLRDIAQTDKPLIGICLGLQLLLSESHEFGNHRGLDIIPGEVVRFDVSRDGRSLCKVPQVCWNHIYPPAAKGSSHVSGRIPSVWFDTLLDGIKEGTFMYFVHSYYVVPEDQSFILSETRYGNTLFCSGIRNRNIYGFQFHPERSGKKGLSIYERLNTTIN